MNVMLHYVRLGSSAALPDDTRRAPFKCVVVVHHAVPAERRTEISRWLVASGCRYVMAWGVDCASWKESMDHANRAAFDFGAIPDERVVITTSHAGDSLPEVFWFSKHSAMHPCFPLDETVLLHLSDTEREAELLGQFSGV